MKSKVILLIVLIIGSLVVLSTWEGVIFVLASVLGDIINGDAGVHSFLGYLQVICLILPIAAIIIAWFKRKTGAILVTLSGFLLFFEPGWWNEDDIFWQPYALMAIGLILLYITFSRRFTLK